MTRRLLLLVLVLAACGGGKGAGDVAPASGIEGMTVSGPQCPVEVAGSPCPDAPIAVGLFITKRGSRAVVATIRSNAQGEFRVALEPGEYTIHPLEQAGPPSGTPVDVTVRRDAYTRVTIEFDSGIR